MLLRMFLFQTGPRSAVSSVSQGRRRRGGQHCDALNHLSRICAPWPSVHAGEAVVRRICSSACTGTGRLALAMAERALVCGKPALFGGGDTGALSGVVAEATKAVQRIGRVEACELVLNTPVLIAC